MGPHGSQLQEFQGATRLGATGPAALRGKWHSERGSERVPGDPYNLPPTQGAVFGILSKPCTVSRQFCCDAGFPDQALWDLVLTQRTHTDSSNHKAKTRWQCDCEYYWSRARLSGPLI